MDNNYWSQNNFNPYTDYQKIAKDYIDSLDLAPKKVTNDNLNKIALLYATLDELNRHHK